jgi:hypothetical protein
MSKAGHIDRLNFWVDEKGIIRISSNGNPPFITTVQNDESPARGHKNLYGHLRDVLEVQGKWPTES